jgi:FHS family L-fucose permease-like MFS transporter
MHLKTIFMVHSLRNGGKIKDAITIPNTTSVMFPSIFTLGIAKLGPLSGDGSGMLIMAIVGGAIIPFVQGILADHLGIHHVFYLPAICYLYIVYYAFRGSDPGSDL